VKVRLVELELLFRQTRSVIPFSEQVSFFDGQVGTGKSSIARLIDFCFGGELTFTPALEQELISAALALEIGEHVAIIYRDREDKGHARLSWERDGEEPQSELVPLAGGGEWDPDKPQTLSDYLFVLAGMTPRRVPKSRTKDETTLERLSFRDFLVFCYLQQDYLDSSFLRFEDPVRRRKSQDVMRALLGLISDRQQELQNQSDRLLRDKNALELEADQATRFLDRLEIGELGEAQEGLARAEQTAAEALAAREREQAGELPAQHPTEALREQLRTLGVELAQQRQALGDIDAFTEQDDRLRSELITAQLKLDRSAVAIEVLSGVRYEHCPQCGNAVDDPQTADSCRLCHRPLADAPAPIPIEATQSDLQTRIDELADSAERHRRARKRELKRLAEVEVRKAALDAQLEEMLREYESTRLATVRRVERELAHAQQEVKRYELARRMRTEIKSMRSQAKQLILQREEVVAELEEENERLREREQNRDRIAAAFHEALAEVGLPGFNREDQVELDDKLVPRVIPAEGTPAYGFSNLGSNGKKTLFQCCYVLALHRVAAEYGLMLPRFLIIDTPTKNIDEQVDAALFHSFYRYLYSLVDGPMADVQVIVVDSDYVAPPEGIDVIERKLLIDDPEHPRLVPYYKGA
jgi:hypothetical protein